MRLHAEAKEPRTDGEKRPVRAADALHAPKLADAGDNGAPHSGVKPAPTSDFAVLEGEDEEIPF